MNFGLTEQQEVIVSTVQSFVEKEMRPLEAAVEKTAEVPKDVAQDIKRQVIDMGFYASNFPEAA